MAAELQSSLWGQAARKYHRKRHLRHEGAAFLDYVSTRELPAAESLLLTSSALVEQVLDLYLTFWTSGHILSHPLQNFCPLNRSIINSGVSLAA